MASLAGHWSHYAALNSLEYIESRTPATAPTSYYFKLYSNNANPDAGPSPTELTDAGYAQQGPETMDHDDTNLTFSNDGDISFGPFSGTPTLAGVACVDHGSGEILWWANLPSLITLAAGSGVDIPAGGFSATLAV